MRLFGRAIEVLAYRTKIETFFGQSFTGEFPNAITIRDMRVQFTVEKTNGSEPNKAEIIVSNLASKTRAELARLPLIVSISAGYDGAARHIFTGDLRNGRSIPRDGTDYETRLQLGDGDRAFRFGHINRSYKSGTSVLHALRDAAAGMGLTLPQNIEVSKALQVQFSSGVALYGPARDELTRLLAPYGYRWSIQNGQLQILRDNETREDRAWPINVGKGMIGSPEWSTPTKAGDGAKLTVKAALYPELTPGGKVEVVSEEINGIFRIEKVTHTGDTDGDEWSTTIEAK